MNPFDDFYRSRRVLVTGHTGFKGSWLALWLQKLGADVTGFALPPATDPSHFAILGLGKKIRHRGETSAILSAVRKAFAEAGARSRPFTLPPRPSSGVPTKIQRGHSMSTCGARSTSWRRFETRFRPGRRRRHLRQVL